MFKEIRRCRLCKKEYETGIWMTGYDTDYVIKRVISPILTEPMHHICEDGSVGLADFVGYKFTDDNECRYDIGNKYIKAIQKFVDDYKEELKWQPGFVQSMCEEEDKTWFSGIESAIDIIRRVDEEEKQ